jgi:Transcriptional regulator of RNA polII, SAGA, subunit
MSLSSTSTIKQQLSSQLGTKATNYFESLNSFVTGRCSRAEFEIAIRHVLDAPTLVQLHNALIISLFDATAVHKRPLTPPIPAINKPPPRKRRRTLLPYQGPTTSDDTLTFRSTRLKRWTLATGKRERDRIHAFESLEPVCSRVDMDEISSERGVILLPERGG